MFVLGSSWSHFHHYSGVWKSTVSIRWVWSLRGRILILFFPIINSEQRNGPLEANMNQYVDILMFQVGPWLSNGILPMALPNIIEGFEYVRCLIANLIDRIKNISIWIIVTTFDHIPWIIGVDKWTFHINGKCTTCRKCIHDIRSFILESSCWGSIEKYECK